AAPDQPTAFEPANLCLEPARRRSIHSSAVNRDYPFDFESGGNPTSAKGELNDSTYTPACSERSMRDQGNCLPDGFHSEQNGVFRIAPAVLLVESRVDLQRVIGRDEYFGVS